MAVQGGVKAGKISKPYGLNGEVHLILGTHVDKHIETGNPLFIELDGQRVPFFIESVYMAEAGQAIVKFEFINSIEEAKKVSGCPVYLDPALDPREVLQKEELAGVVGFHVEDRILGPLGRLVEYVPGGMNPVWIIDFSGKELLIPAQKDFVLKIDTRNRMLYLTLPEGITDL